MSGEERIENGERGATPHATAEAAARSVRPRLLGWLRRVAGDLPELEAEDVAQEAFASLLGADAAEVIFDAGAWLFRAAKNRRVSSLRKKGRETHFASDHPEGDGEPEAGDARPGPFENAARSEMTEALFSALAELAEEDRNLVRRIELEGETHQAVADDLGWPLGTVLARKHRALARLRAGLEERGFSSGHLFHE